MHQLDPIVQVAVIIGIICTTVMGIGKCNGTFLIGALFLLVYLTCQSVNAMSGVLHENILKQVPSTIESALSKLNIHSKTIPYAICSCHCTYAPVYAEGSSIPTYPQYCTNMVTLESQCGESLLESSPCIRNCPKKTFVYHDFNDYLRTLLS